MSGYFRYVFILLFIIIFHELGHLFFAYLIGYKKASIVIYPFGGITRYDGYLNASMLHELLILIGGPLFQEILYLILLFLYNKNLISNINFNIISLFHKNLLYFNFLPIIPLDGSKLILLILEKIFSYKKSNLLLIIISFITIFLFAIFEKRLIFILFSCLLIKSIIEEANVINIKYNKFLLERYLYNFKFKKGRLINSVDKIKRSKKHNIINNNIIYSEKEYLNKYFNN